MDPLELLDLGMQQLQQDFGTVPQAQPLPNGSAATKGCPGCARLQLQLSKSDASRQKLRGGLELLKSKLLEAEVLLQEKKQRELELSAAKQELLAAKESVRQGKKLAQKLEDELLASRQQLSIEVAEHRQRLKQQERRESLEKRRDQQGGGEEVARLNRLVESLQKQLEPFLASPSGSQAVPLPPATRSIGVGTATNGTDSTRSSEKDVDDNKVVARLRREVSKVKQEKYALELDISSFQEKLALLKKEHEREKDQSQSLKRELEKANSDLTESRRDLETSQLELKAAKLELNRKSAGHVTTVSRDESTVGDPENDGGFRRRTEESLLALASKLDTIYDNLLLQSSRHGTDLVKVPLVNDANSPSLLNTSNVQEHNEKSHDLHPGENGVCNEVAMRPSPDEVSELCQHRKGVEGVPLEAKSVRNLVEEALEASELNIGYTAMVSEAITEHLRSSAKQVEDAVCCFAEAICACAASQPKFEALPGAQRMNRADEECGDKASQAVLQGFWASTEANDKNVLYWLLSIVNYVTCKTREHNNHVPVFSTELRRLLKQNVVGLCRQSAEEMEEECVGEALVQLSFIMGSCRSENALSEARVLLYDVLRSARYCPSFVLLRYIAVIALVYPLVLGRGGRCGEDLGALCMSTQLIVRDICMDAKENQEGVLLRELLQQPEYGWELSLVGDTYEIAEELCRKFAPELMLLRNRHTKDCSSVDASKLLSISRAIELLCVHLGWQFMYENLIKGERLNALLLEATAVDPGHGSESASSVIARNFLGSLGSLLTEGPPSKLKVYVQELLCQKLDLAVGKLIGFQDRSLGARRGVLLAAEGEPASELAGIQHELLALFDILIRYALPAGKWQGIGVGSEMDDERTECNAWNYGVQWGIAVEKDCSDVDAELMRKLILSFDSVQRTMYELASSHDGRKLGSGKRKRLRQTEALPCTDTSRWRWIDRVLRRMAM
eukprot:scaffold2761_cov391-Prasinococcus_capsulatus_cf.AAC.3